MTSIYHLPSRLGLAALLAATALPGIAHAGDQTRAEAAIAEARGKIDAGDKVGAGNQAPELFSQAKTALMAAEDQLSHHQKKDAIATAHHASQLADQAIVSANNRVAAAEHARREDMRDSTMAAQQSATNANIRADSAQQATTMANMRADSAERSSAAANAQVDSMRAMPPVVAPPATTTVAVTEHETVAAPAAPARRPHKRIVHRHVRTVKGKTTTTVVTTTHP